mgnify:CR=1 FL=1
MIFGILSTIINPLLIFNDIIIYSSLLSILLIYKKDINYHIISFIVGFILDKG